MFRFRIKKNMSDADRNTMAEAEWSRIVRTNRGQAEEQETQYNLWAKERRKLFEKWGNLPTTDDENKRLRALKGKYSGERIFILGSGPSIRQTPLDLLKDEFTFGVNRMYLLYDSIQWRPTFYTVNDWEVGPDNSSEIADRIDSIFFCPTRFRGLFPNGDDTFIFRSCHSKDLGADFSYDLTDGAVMGGTVLTLAIQIAFFMGFDPIYLVGVDVDYKVLDSVKQSGTKRFSDGNLQFLQSTEDDDPNHFDARYFGRGRRWHNPNIENMVIGFENCRNAIEAKGRRIYNATVGGKLEVLPRREFTSLFETEDGRGGELLGEAETDRPLVSIVMPAYNAAPYIAEAIQSILKQSVSDWELIVVDDGSVDETASIVEGFHDSRIRLVRQENRGRASARNVALEMAGGEFIAFLDADDAVEHDKLQIQVDLLRSRPDVHGVVGGCKRVDEQGEIIRISNPGNGIIPASDFLTGNPVNVCMSLMRRDFVDNGLRFESSRRYAEDWEFNLRLAMANGYKFLRHKDVVGIYRSTPQALTKTTSEYARAHISVVDNAFNNKISTIPQEEYVRARFAVTTRMAGRFFGTNQPNLGNKFLLEASAFRPKSDSEYISMTANALIFWSKHFGIETNEAIAAALDESILSEAGLLALPEAIRKRQNAGAGKPNTFSETGQLSRTADIPRKMQRPFYADLGDWLKWRSPRLFRFLQRRRHSFVDALKIVPVPFSHLRRTVSWIQQAPYRYKFAILLLLIVGSSLIFYQ